MQNFSPLASKLRAEFELTGRQHCFPSLSPLYARLQFAKVIFPTSPSSMEDNLDRNRLNFVQRSQAWPQKTLISHPPDEISNNRLD